MKEFVEFIAKKLVDFPDDIKLSQESSDNGILLKLFVKDEDKGRVIGKQGRTIEAMRSLLHVLATKQGTKVKLEIV